MDAVVDVIAGGWLRDVTFLGTTAAGPVPLGGAGSERGATVLRFGLARGAADGCFLGEGEEDGEDDMSTSYTCRWRKL